MRIKINKKDYGKLVRVDWEDILEECWQDCAEWLIGQSRIADAYIDERLKEENKINEAIVKRTYSLGSYNPGDTLPEPNPDQIKKQNYYLNQWEKHKVGYNFYNHSTHKPVRARWLHANLTKWDAKLNNPLSKVDRSFRDLKGVEREGELNDPLLDTYLEHHGEIDPVLQYCRSLIDVTLLEAHVNIGCQRGPFGEFATDVVEFATGALKMMKKESGDKVAYAYAELFDKVSLFYSTFSTLKPVARKFIDVLKEVRNPTTMMINLTKLSPYIIQYCSTIKKLIDDAIQLKISLKRYLRASKKAAPQPESNIIDMNGKLVNSILLLNHSLELFIETKLAEVTPEDYEPSEDYNADDTPKISAPLIQKQIFSLLSQKVEDEQELIDFVSPRPAEITTPPRGSTGSKVRSSSERKHRAKSPSPPPRKDAEPKLKNASSSSSQSISSPGADEPLSTSGKTTRLKRSSTRTKQEQSQKRTSSRERGSPKVTRPTGVNPLRQPLPPINSLRGRSTEETPSPRAECLSPRRISDAAWREAREATETTPAFEAPTLKQAGRRMFKRAETERSFTSDGMPEITASPKLPRALSSSKRRKRHPTGNIAQQDETPGGASPKLEKALSRSRVKDSGSKKDRRQLPQDEIPGDGGASPKLEKAHSRSRVSKDSGRKKEQRSVPQDRDPEDDGASPNLERISSGSSARISVLKEQGSKKGKRLYHSDERSTGALLTKTSPIVSPLGGSGRADLYANSTDSSSPLISSAEKRLLSPRAVKIDGPIMIEAYNKGQSK